MANIFKRFNAWFEKWFGPNEVICSECGQKYLSGVPGHIHKCSMKTLIKNAILEAEEEKKK